MLIYVGVQMRLCTGSCTVLYSTVIAVKGFSVREGASQLASKIPFNCGSSLYLVLLEKMHAKVHYTYRTQTQVQKLVPEPENVNLSETGKQGPESRFAEVYCGPRHLCITYTVNNYFVL